MPQTTTDTLPLVTTDQLRHVNGGAGGLDPAAIGGQIGGLVDMFTGGNGQGAKLGGGIGALIKSFL